MASYLRYWRALVCAVAVLVLAGAAAGVSWSATAYDPATDPYSMAAVTTATGATALWNAGYTGDGVDVAVIDTGVSPVPGLDGAGKIINGPDLSLESQNPALRYLDTNGHGTFMAGLIAGNSAAYKGIAPNARIVNVKVGVADGGVDVSQVIAAINWVIQHRTDNGLNIRVISLSYGTNSVQSFLVDPLSYAVDQAWKAGIVVVAAVGNSGFQNGKKTGEVANPAFNPDIIAVGAYDTKGTTATSDDVVGTYSTGACRNCRAPDFVAPGSHIQGLRVPNGYVDQTHPEGRLGSLYFRGTGSSQATAITAGAVALLLQKYPAGTPNQLKVYVRQNARKLTSGAYTLQGRGAINLAAFVNYAWALTDFPDYTNPGDVTGTGTLDGARGTDRVTDDGVVLSGEKDIFGHAFDSAAMATLEAAGNSWSGGTWNGNSWSGNSWSGNSWSGNSWSGSSWSGNSWSGNSWSGNSWSGSSWSGNSWSGNSWSGNSWSGNTWSTLSYT